MVSSPKSRVRIWNTFFRLAWGETKSLFEASTGDKSKKEFTPLGGTLGEKEFHTLSSLVLCTLAIEARANHLIEELVEENKISRAVAKAAQHLPIKHKWFLLPMLAGISKTIDADEAPHQSVAEICEMRNKLFHVDYKRLKKGLPAPGKMLSLFSGFVEAMEDMNVVLGRVDKIREEVLEIGHFG